MSENRVAVIKNPGAGGVADDTGVSLDRAFREAQVNYKLFESEDPASAATTALEEGYLHLCACGGDGTVSGVVNAILRSNAENARLSIIPLGTGNVIAAALEVPIDLAEAVALVSTGSTRLVDAGKVGSDFFVLGIGIGATERFVTQAGDEAKEKLGRLAYVISLFRHASAATHMADIQVDGKKQASMRADAITLASMWGTRGRKMLEDSLADDGVMELVVNKRFSKWALFRLAWRGLRGDLASDEDVAVFSGARFTISTTPSLPIQLDGNESQLVTPIEVEVLPRALCVSVSVT